MKSDANNTLITVKDNGKGFEATQPRAVSETGGQGLFSLVDRAESIGGSLDIMSAPGQGTSITLMLPSGDP